MGNKKSKAGSWVEFVFDLMAEYIEKFEIDGDGYASTKDYYVRFLEEDGLLQFGSKRNWDRWANSVEYYTETIPETKEDVDLMMRFLMENLPPQSGDFSQEIEFKLNNLKRREKKGSLTLKEGSGREKPKCVKRRR